MTVEPWSPRPISNIADARSAFLIRQQRRRKERLAQLITLMVTIGVGAIATTLFGPERSEPIPGAEYRTFQLCGWRNRRNCVIDGDTIRHEGVKIRLAGIDAPEISTPRCFYEHDLGQKAKRRLLELLNGGPITIVPTRGPDAGRYGRKLRVILQNGRSVGDILVAEGWRGAGMEPADRGADQHRSKALGNRLKPSSPNFLADATHLRAETILSAGPSAQCGRRFASSSLTWLSQRGAPRLHASWVHLKQLHCNCRIARTG
jgi:micrococcal nuclease